MQNSEITDVFFDLDHTLWDFDRNSGLAFKRVFEKFKIELTLSEFLKVYEPINFEYWKKYREDRVTKEELRRGRLTDAFKIFNLTFQLETIDAIAHSYIEELPQDNFLFSGAVEILDYLSEKYKLHIITNGFEEVQHLKLQNSGITKYFKTVTTSEEVGSKKPNPLIFKTALGKAAVTSKKSVMIGDNIEADIMGAQNAGMYTVFFNYRNEAVKNQNVVINQLSEIKNYL